MTVSRTQAIKNFLEASTHSDLANRYSYSMEAQVNVAQDNGKRIDGEFKGRQWHGWTDDIQTWKSFRIPFHAKSEPEYTDKKMTFDLATHVEGIGMTGWDWENQVSKWVAFDFDAITGHSEKHTKKLSDSEIQEIKEKAKQVEWVSLRYSTSGTGLHLYISLPDIPTSNHNEHAALARAILGKLSALSAFDFSSKVDICGGNMWVWHRKMSKSSKALALIKEGTVMPEEEIPPNWKDHIKVIKGGRRKNLPQCISSAEEQTFEELTGQYTKINLDSEHQKLIQFLKEKGCLWWWDNDYHMLVTHTYHLKEAFDDLELKGIFDTLAQGKEYGNDWNCFCFPLRRGAWCIRRFSIGVGEHDSWEQDGAGWTRCFLNKEPDLKIASRTFDGVEDVKGGFLFANAELASKSASTLGTFIDIPSWALGRKTKLKEHKDGRLIVEIEKNDSDSSLDMKGWLPDKKNWTKIFNTQATLTPVEPQTESYDDLVRHIVTESGDDYGWVINSGEEWRTEPLIHVKTALESTGMAGKDVKQILGNSIFKCWTLVNIPFQPEYPGDRKWNRNAPQYAYKPKRSEDTLVYPTWNKVFNHCGVGLDESVKINPWCQANGIVSGGEYLKCWVASLLKEPLEPLPYLFFYGPQNSGKSIFHEAFQLLTIRGYTRADNALISQSGFNGELENAVLCVIEETDLRINKTAYNRIKDWVTSKFLPIHRKRRTPYHVPNSTHWVQCANDHKECPIFPGDTRITVIYVPTLDPIEMIPKRRLLEQLTQEASDFLTSLLNLELPPSSDRLGIPVIGTVEKNSIESSNQNLVEMFLDEFCYKVDGAMIKFSDLHEKFLEWLDPNWRDQWGKIKFGRELPLHFPKGRLKENNHVYVGNISWTSEPVSKRNKLKLSGGHLVEH